MSPRQGVCRLPVELHPKGAVSGAEVPVLVPDNSPEFASICIGLHFRVQSMTAKTEVRKRKETPRELGVSEINAAFSSDYRSGETGIRTLGTREGTPVFKTGLYLTQLPTWTRVAIKTCCWGADHGDDSFIAVNCRIFSFLKGPSSLDTELSSLYCLSS